MRKNILQTRQPICYSLNYTDPRKNLNFTDGSIMARKEEAYEYLKNCIITNKMKSGQPLSEPEISKKLQMSRTPVREAIRELEKDGLVVSYPARGAHVAVLSVEDVEEICDLRVLLEVWCLERGMHNISDERLDELCDMFEAAEKDGRWEEFHKADRALHGTIVGASGNGRVIEIVAQLNGQIDRIRHNSAADPNRSKYSYREHMAILDAIKQRNLIRARERLMTHLYAVAESAKSHFLR